MKRGTGIKTFRSSIALAAAVAVTSLARGDEPRRVYIANDDHTDYMWTADADTYARCFVDQLDFQLRLADMTASNEPRLQSKFNCDGSYWIWEYEHRKSPAEFARLMARVKDGTITVPMNLLVSCYGAQPAEAALRGFYYAGRLERRYDLKIPIAMAMENQTLPLGLSSLFAGSGVNYSWRGVCGCASKLKNDVLGARPHDVYWYTGPDGGRVLMKWYSLGPHGLGTYTEAGGPWVAVKALEASESWAKRYVDPQTKQPYAVVGLFGFGGDDLMRKTGTPPPPAIPGVPGLQKVVSSGYCDHFFTVAEQMTTPERQVIVSNEVDFFKDFESHYGKTLASEQVTYGNEWDLYSASMAETSARVKRAVEKLRAAELLAAIVSLKYPAFMANHVDARDRAYNALGLFWEHDWTADGPVARGDRAAWQDLQASTIEYYVDSIYGEAIIRLGGMIPRPTKGPYRFFVLNPLGWQRTDVADFAYTGSADVHVRDVTTGRDVPSQIVNVNGARMIRVLAADVPSAGYKVYEFRSGKGDAPADDAATATDDGVLENAVVKLVVDHDGAIRSFIDKRHGNVELAADIDGAKLNDLAPGVDAGEPFKVENRGPVSVTLCARSDANLDHTTAITLYRDSDRVDVRNEITSNFGKSQYWSFSTTLDKPAVHTEEVGAINLDKRKSDGGDYADTHARYDHVTVNHFADVTDGANTRGLTISNADLAFARIGNSTTNALDTTTPQVNLLAGGQVDGRYLGIQDQNGASRFLQRFALRGHGAYDPAAAMRFALEHQNPLVAGAMPGGEAGLLPATNYSLLTTTDPNVLLWALKPADDGIDRGIVARLWNVADAPASTTLRAEPGVASAARTTHVETDIEPAAVTGDGLKADFARQEIRTYRLTLKPTASTAPTSAPATIPAR